MTLEMPDLVLYIKEKNNILKWYAVQRPWTRLLCNAGIANYIPFLLVISVGSILNCWCTVAAGD